ncbi:MAG: hypothetical protein EPO24_04835 [Bacteroidetes bacterium]|nr:MAG: hypothetical protein EPO24_04835 [Bacteroidota bacterium]
MKKSIILSFVLVVAIGFTAFSPQEKKGAKTTDAGKGKATQLSYKKDIAPILKKYCLPCHTEDMMNPSELYLDSYENIMAGGKHGKPIIVGKPDSSNLIKKISLKPPFGDPMPLKRKTEFPADTLKILKAWIEHGAKNN